MLFMSNMLESFKDHIRNYDAIELVLSSEAKEGGKMWWYQHCLWQVGSVSSQTPSWFLWGILWTLAHGLGHIRTHEEPSRRGNQVLQMGLYKHRHLYSSM